MFKALVENANKCQIGPQRHHQKGLETKALNIHKVPHIVHLYLICMSYDQKKKQESNQEFDSQPQILKKKGSNKV